MLIGNWADSGHNKCKNVLGTASLDVLCGGHKTCSVTFGKNRGWECSRTGCWGRYLDLRRRKELEIPEKYTLRNLTICTLQQILFEWWNHAGWDEWGKKKLTQDFGRETLRVHWEIFLKLTSNKYDRREWTALNKIKQTNLSSFLVFNWHSTLMDQCAICSRCIECRYPSSTCTNPLCQCSLATDSNILSVQAQAAYPL